jgi:outer membrane lipoprotein LolB
MMNKLGLVLAILLLQSGCAFIEEKPVETYQMADRRYFKQDRPWQFDGRIALANEKESISASINWIHQLDSDDIELTGPLAQGRLAIKVLTDKVIIEDGDNRQEFQGSAESIFTDQLGVEVPVKALRYWVLGANDPHQAFVDQGDGFRQSGWSVRFKEMQQVNGLKLPHKIGMEKDLTKIKLIVDEWKIK